MPAVPAVRPEPSRARRAAVLVLAAAALGACAVVYLGDSGGASAANGSTGVGATAWGAVRFGALAGRTTVLDEFGDWDSSGGGGDFSTSDDLDRLSGGGEDDFGSAEDLEDSGGYVGYLAWSDAKLQRILNHTHAELHAMARQWNATYSPAHLAKMQHQLWALRSAFTRHGYLLADATSGLHTLETLATNSVHDVLSTYKAISPKIRAELAQIVNASRAMRARQTGIDAQQGRLLIKAEQVDLNTTAAVRHRVQEAEEMLHALQAREANVTIDLVRSAAEFGRAAAKAYQSAPVTALLSELPRKFSVQKLAVQAVRDEDLVHRKVTRELQRLGAVEGREERLVARARATAAQLAAEDHAADGHLNAQDHAAAGAAAALQRRLAAQEMAVARREAGDAVQEQELVAQEKRAGAVLARGTDPCRMKRREAREWKQLLAELKGKLQGLEEAYSDEKKAYQDAVETQQHNIAEGYEQHWIAEHAKVIAAALESTLSSARSTGELLTAKTARERAALAGRVEELRAERKLLRKIGTLISEAKLSEAKGEAQALLKTFYASRPPRLHAVAGAAGDMLGSAGKSALGAVATGLLVSSPKQMSRVSRLLGDMLVQVQHDAALLKQEMHELEDKVAVHDAKVEVLRAKAANASRLVANATALEQERLAARPALAMAVQAAKDALAKARGADSRRTYMLRDSIRRVTNRLKRAKYQLETCKLTYGLGSRPEVLASTALRRDWRLVEHVEGLRPVVPDAAVVADVRRLQRLAVLDLEHHEGVPVSDPGMIRGGASGAMATPSARGEEAFWGAWRSGASSVSTMAGRHPGQTWMNGQSAGPVTPGRAQRDGDGERQGGWHGERKFKGEPSMPSGGQVSAREFAADTAREEARLRERAQRAGAQWRLAARHRWTALHRGTDANAWKRGQARPLQEAEDRLAALHTRLNSVAAASSGVRDSVGDDRIPPLLGVGRRQQDGARRDAASQGFTPGTDEAGGYDDWSNRDSSNWHRHEYLAGGLGGGGARGREFSVSPNDQALAAAPQGAAGAQPWIHIRAVPTEVDDAAGPDTGLEI